MYDSVPREHALLRMLLAAAAVAAVLAYTFGVISGHIAEEEKVDAVHFALLGATLLFAIVLVRPQMLDRLRLFEIGGVRLEMLERVRETQQKQESELEDIKLILPLLLPETERKHLLNLANGTTSGYKASSAMRNELRRLRSVGLVRMQPERFVSSMKEGLVLDLAEYVSLTDLGDRWVRRIKQIEQADDASEYED